MNDTSPEMASRFRRLIMEKSGEERLIMGCFMFDDAKRIVKSSITGQHADIFIGRMKKEFFLRFYGKEFTAPAREKILAHIASS